jgi:hypothetical protein
MKKHPSRLNRETDAVDEGCGGGPDATRGNGRGHSVADPSPAIERKDGPVAEWIAVRHFGACQLVMLGERNIGDCSALLAGGLPEAGRALSVL